jgi:feruloyl esterase
MNHSKKRIPIVAVAMSLFLTGVVAVGIAGASSGATSGRIGDRSRTAPEVATPISPAISCASLAGQTFTESGGTPSKITSAVTTTQGGITYCEVSGYTSPQTDFEVLLPETTFEGDYIQEGCGGFCGIIPISTQPDASTNCLPVTNGQLAIGTDDQGHVGGSADGAWAADDLTLRVEYAYTSEHIMAEFAKALIAAYYGAPPKYSYYDGCSGGGREGLEEAQRYPTDFNGIIAGSPGLDTPGIVGILFPYLIQSNTAPGGGEILGSEKLPALHAAVMAACANSDGAIVDPRQCTFNPASIECPAGVDNNSCLTSAQVTVVREFYRGPTDPAGKSLYDGGMPYGSELAWGSGWIVGPSTDPAWPIDTFAYQTSVNYLKYMGFYPNPPSSFTPYDVQFTDAYFQKIQQFAELYNSADPDLKAFDQAGGKLIIYQGWADQLALPWPTLNYYSAVEHTMGGFVSAQAFSRLYMIPGGYHCFIGGGDPSTTFDLLTPLINWVENGVAPATITATVVSQTTGTSVPSLNVAPLDASSSAPQNAGLNSGYKYFGIKSTYQQVQTWCNQDGFNLVCKDTRNS